MSYQLFLDDERLPHRVTWVNLPAGPWTVVRNYNEFVKYIEKNGIPIFVSFDHDLAEEHYIPEVKEEIYKEKTGYHCARWLVEKCMNENRKFPDYVVHSMNPIGRENIRSIIENYKNLSNR